MRQSFPSQMWFLWHWLGDFCKFCSYSSFLSNIVPERWPADSTEIVSLTFDHEPSAVTATVDQSSSVGLNCVWNHGNPPQTVRLLDRRRQVMKTSDLYSTVNYLKHTWQSVTCDDAGVVTCEDGVADVNKSVRLLVRCESGLVTWLIRNVQ